MLYFPKAAAFEKNFYSLVWVKLQIVDPTLPIVQCNL